MKKALGGFLSAVITGMLLAGSDGHTFDRVSCVSGAAAGRAAGTVKAAWGAGQDIGEGLLMQIAYRLARRSIVKTAVKGAAGSGIIWLIDDEIVIVSNRHLLMRDVEAEVTFCNGETVKAGVLGYSQQYDIGFLRIPREEVSGRFLRDIYEAVPVLYDTGSEHAEKEFSARYAGGRILQVGASSDRGTDSVSVGTIRGLAFVPLFNTRMLETACFSQAGMSGGGVFDGSGRLVGMISGGDVPQDSTKKEAGLTYSIPPALIMAEYDAVSGDAR